MPVGKKKSPAKFIGAVTAGLGIMKGVTSIIGGVQEKKRLKEQNRIAGEQYDSFRKDIQGLDIVNPYKDLNTSFENTYEDMTVNQQQAQFQAQQGAQARANLMTNLSSAAGGSGIAGLAQAMANQQQTQTQQISAEIGQQEASIQRMSAQGAMSVQRMEQGAEQTVMGGEATRQANENKRQMQLMELKAGRQQGVRDYENARSAQNQAIMGGIGGVIGAGVTGFAGGGGFSEGGFKMDTFLGKGGGKKKSPAKFIGAVTAGLGIMKGAGAVGTLKEQLDQIDADNIKAFLK